MAVNVRKVFSLVKEGDHYQVNGGIGRIKV